MLSVLSTGFIGADHDEPPDTTYEVGGDDVGDADADDGSSASGDDLGDADDGAGGHEGTGSGDRGDVGGRVEGHDRLSGKDTDGDECSLEGVSDTGLDDEQYGDFQGEVEYAAGSGEPEVYLPPEPHRGAPSAIPRLESLHTMAPSFASSKTVEGGPENLRHNTKAAGSPFYPFATKEQQLSSSGSMNIGSRKGRWGGC